MSKEIDPNLNKQEEREVEYASTPLNNPDYIVDDESYLQNFGMYEDEGQILKKLFRYQ